MALQLGPLSRPFNLTPAGQQQKGWGGLALARAAPKSSGFVRPDCPPVGKDKKEQAQAKGPASAWPRADEDTASSAPQPRAARFRSALEQVSWETNKQLYDTEKQPQRARKPLLSYLGL